MKDYKYYIKNIKNTFNMKKNKYKVNNNLLKEFRGYDSSSLNPSRGTNMPTEKPTKTLRVFFIHNDDGSISMYNSETGELLAKNR